MFQLSCMVHGPDLSSCNLLTGPCSILLAANVIPSTLFDEAVAVRHVLGTVEVVVSLVLASRDFTDGVSNLSK